MKTLIKSVLTLSITSALLVQSAYAEDETPSYSIVDLGLVDTVKNTYGIEQNDLGKALLSGQTTYNFPVQFDYLDDDDYDNIVSYAERNYEAVFDLFKIDSEAEELLRAGTPDANALSWTIRYLRVLQTTEYQKYGDSQAYVFDANSNSVTELQIFDDVFPGTDTLTRSTVDVPKGVTRDGWYYGYSSAPILPLPPFEDGDELEVHWVNEFPSRGWVSFDGVSIVELPPQEATYGGLSAVNGFNNNRVAVGTGSVELNERGIEDIEAEDDYCDDRKDDIPIEACIQIVRNNLYYSNAFKWELDESGTIIETTDLGTGIINPDEDDKRPFTSSAEAINDNGIIVGHSHFWWDEDEITPSKTERVGSFAAVFKDGQVIDFTDRDDYFESRANAINNNDLFTGYMYRYVNGKPRTKFYYANASDEVITPIFPEDFFKGSASIGFGINDNGLIVGEGEIEDFVDSTSTPRRRHGFLYDTHTDSFYNINQFLSCEDQKKYTIVEARDINEQNEILATAWVKSEKLNSKGEPFNEGEYLEEDVLRAVYLRPLNGEYAQIDCSKDLGQKTERQGASFGLFSILSLLLVGFRRRK